VGQGHQGCHVTIIGALYHPPAPKYSTSDLLNYIEAAVIQAQNEFPQVHITLARDLSILSDSELVERTGLRSIVSQPTRGHSKLEGVYVSDLDYSGVKVIKSVAKSDHMAVVAYTGEM